MKSVAISTVRTSCLKRRGNCPRKEERLEWVREVRRWLEGKRGPRKK